MYSLETKKQELLKKNVPDKKYTRRVYSTEEIKEILKDYIEISKSKIETLKPGSTRICYIRADDNSFCRGGFINVNPIERKDDGERYLQLRGNVRKTGKGNVIWLVPYSGIVRIWIYASAEYEYARQEIQKVARRQKEELSTLVDKISIHLRSLKKEIKELKKEVKLLKEGNANVDDTQSTASGKTNFTDFTVLKVYQDSETD